MGIILIRVVNYLCLILLMGCFSENKQMQYPETKKDDVQEVIFGKTITDPYRWLEDFTSEEASAWVDKQNDLTNTFLENNSFSRGGVFWFGQGGARQATSICLSYY